MGGAPRRRLPQRSEDIKSVTASAVINPLTAKPRKHSDNATTNLRPTAPVSGQNALQGVLGVISGVLVGQLGWAAYRRTFASLNGGI